LSKKRKWRLEDKFTLKITEEDIRNQLNLSPKEGLSLLSYDDSYLSAVMEIMIRIF